MSNLNEIISFFPEVKDVKEITPLTAGLINQTYKVETADAKSCDYILQCINNQVFQDVDLLQHNIECVTRHIRKKLEEAHETEINRKVLRFVPAADGKTYHFDGEHYWRVSEFIPDSLTLDAVTPESSYLVGLKFGEFEAMLADIPEKLGETIPDFHNMEARLETFRETISKNPANRLVKAQWMVDELLARADKMCTAQRLYRKGKLPKRVTHCDTKVNNILFDEEDRPLCVIDLDTTMPGFVLSDFGDFIRTSANTGAEDDPDLDRIDVNMDIFRSFAKGYIESTAAFLTPIERQLLPYGALLLTYMQTVRFLTDYLDGDHYYKIKHPEHNWQRSEAQFRLLQRLEAKEQEMNDYIASL